MNRDIIKSRIDEDLYLITTMDNAGSIGELENDQVNVSLENLVYLTTRVALFELLAVGARPISLAFSNFYGSKYNNRIVNCVKKLFIEFDYSNIKMISSTETNFTMNQSAFSVVINGLVSCNELRLFTPKKFELAIIGEPLIGDEVKENKSALNTDDIKKMLVTEGIYEILPVGSKGIDKEIKYFTNMKYSVDLDVAKSAGPSTCAIISYDTKYKDELRNKFNIKMYEIKDNLERK